ncbi:MAG: DUF58 domain-containing protein [Myxococcales bacterium]|nr:DUF58 domain-containing protein [Myxococcota bacterium]MDW8280127.1 DUF58 domain-containing protein [Myxococcales bacterium]
MGAPARDIGFDQAFLKKLEYLHVVARRVFAGRLRAERRSRKAGTGVEFADHRDYAPGDDLRYLDWSVYGRMDRLLLRLFEEEEDLHIYLLVDASASMRVGDGGGKLRYAAQVAAALAYVGLANLDRVSVLAFGDGLRARLPAARGKGRIFKILDFLAGLQARGETRLAETLSAFVHQTPRRGVVVLISDCYDPGGYEDGLNMLRYHRFEPSVIQVVDAREAAPQLRGDLEIVDMETGALRQVTLSPRLCEEYARRHRAYCEGLQAFCSSRGMSYIRADTAVPFEDLVLRVFRMGGFLR